MTTTTEARRKPGTLRRIVTDVATIVVVTALLVLLFLAVGEAYLRLTIPASSGSSIFEYTMATKRYKVMKRDFRSVVWGKEFRTNGLGFRDRQLVVPPKAAGEYRVIVLGDSFTASAGVDFDDIFTSLLEKHIKADHPTFKVIHLAVGGYSPIQYAMVLEEVGMSLQPDMVLVAVFPFNDLSNADYRQNYAAATGKHVPTDPAWYQRFYLYQAFYPRIEARLNHRRPSARTPAAVAAAAANAKRVAEDSAQNLRALAGIVDTARAHGMDALVALLPHTGAFERQRGFFAPFVAFCRESHLPCVNLLDGFVAAHLDSRTLPLNRIDDHPNANYHRAVAALLEPALRQAMQRRESRSSQGVPPRSGQAPNALRPDQGAPRVQIGIRSAPCGSLGSLRPTSQRTSTSKSMFMLGTHAKAPAST